MPCDAGGSVIRCILGKNLSLVTGSSRLAFAQNNTSGLLPINYSHTIALQASIMGQDDLHFFEINLINR